MCKVCSLDAGSLQVVGIVLKEVGIVLKESLG